MTILNKNQVSELCIYIESKIEDQGCDHSLKHTLYWGDKNNINTSDLIDILEANGGYCDCETAMNLPENQDLELETTKEESDLKNPFKIPLNFEHDKNHLYTKAIFSDQNELLIPAPFGSKPKKKIRRSMHFFNGTASEMPYEIGFVKEIESISGKEFAKNVRNSKLDSFSKFTKREAAYYLSRVNKVDIDKPMGTHFMEKRGIGGKKLELRIHKVILRK